MNFDKFILDIIGNIEEKRLVFGARLIKFYQRRLELFINFWQKNINFKYQFWCLNLLIVFTSVYIRSAVDIGAESIINIKLAIDLVDLGKIPNHTNFASYFTVFLLIPVVLTANFLDFSSFILFDYYINLLAIFIILLINKILNSHSSFVKKYAKIITSSYLVAFFLRPNILVYNDFITNHSVALLLIFLLTAILIAKGKNFFTQDFLVIKLLSSLIFILNPHSLILIIALFSVPLIDGSKKK